MPNSKLQKTTRYTQFISIDNYCALHKLLKPNLNLDYIITFDVKAETRRWAIEVEEDSGENVTSGAETATALPNHLQRLVYHPLVLVSIVDSSEEEPVHAQLREGRTVGERERRERFKYIFYCVMQHVQGLFWGGGGQGGALAPPIKVFAPPQELVEFTY